MSVSRSVAEILREHVTLEAESIDRMYLNVYVPRLQTERGVVAFFRYHRGHPFASSALMDPISKAFVRAIEAFAVQAQVPLVSFAPKERKDDVMAAHLVRLPGMVEDALEDLPHLSRSRRIVRQKSRLG
jgi:hypothetical protein